MNRVNWTTVVLLTLGGCLLQGCATRVETKPYQEGRILVLPVQDAVHDYGGDAPFIEGTGRSFQEKMVSGFADSPFVAVTSQNEQLTAPENPGWGRVVREEASRMGADYCLRTVLGEVHTAAPKAYRPDYAYLQTAWLYDVKNDEVVWKLPHPLYVEKSNNGDLSMLFEAMAVYVTDSICENMD